MDSCAHVRFSLIKPSIFFIIAIVVWFLLPTASQAANLYWVGNSGASTATATNWKTTDPSACGSGDAGAAPSTGDVAIFDADCDNNAALDAAMSVAGFTINTGYSGTVTQSATLTVGSSGYSQAAGTFTGGSQAITVSGLYTLSGGTFTSTSGTLSVGPANQTSSQTIFTVSVGATFTHNSGTVKFEPSLNTYSVLAFTVDVPTTLTLNNVTINIGAGPYPHSASITVASGDTVTVAGTFTQTDGRVEGTWNTQGNIVIDSTADGGTGSMVVNGTGTQTISGGTTGTGAVIDINKSSGTFALADGVTNLGIDGLIIRSANSFTAPTGTLRLGATSVGLESASRTIITIESGATFTHNSGTVKFEPSLNTYSVLAFTVDVPTTLTLNNVNVNIQGGAFPNTASITVASGDTVTVAGTFTQTDGRVEGTWNVQSNIVIGSGADGGLGSLVVNGTGAQTISGGTTGTGPIIDINKSSGTFALADGVTDLSIDGLIIRSGNSFTAPTGTLRLGATSVGLEGASRTIFNLISGATFTHNSGTVEFKPTLSTYSVLAFTVDVPTTLTLNNVIVNIQGNGFPHTASITVASGDTVTVAGTFTQTDGNIAGTWEVQGAVTVGSGFDGGSATLSFTGTANQIYTDNGGNEPDGDVTINKSSGTVTLASNADWNATSQDVTITSGTLSLASYTIATNVLTVSASGIFQLRGSETVTATTKTLSTGSTIKYLGDADGSSDTYTITSQFTIVDNLTINSTDGATDTFQLGAALTVNRNLTITTGTFDVSSSNYGVSVGGNLANSGTFTARSGTVTLASTSGSATLTSGGSSFYNLTQNGSGGTYTLQDALDVNNTLTITAGTLDVSSSNYALTVGGNLANSGTLTTRLGTITLDGIADQTFTTGGATLYSLTLNNTGSSGSDDIIVSGNLDIDNILTITDGDLDISTNDPNVNLAGNVTIATAGSLDNSSYTGTLTFDGTGTDTLTDNAGVNFRTATLDGSSSKVLQLSTAATFTTLTIGTDDTLDLNGKNITITTLANNGTFKLQGGETVTLTDGMDTDSGTIIYTGTSTYTTLPAGYTYYHLTFNGSGGTWPLTQNLTVNGSLTITTGTLNSNSRTITLVGTGTVFSNSGSFTQGRSVIQLTDTSSTSKTFAGGSNTYYNMEITGGGSGAVTITGNNTFNRLAVNAPKTVTFAAGSTTAIQEALQLAGSTSSNRITLNSATSGSPFYLQKSQGIVEADYLALQDSSATGGASWYAGTNSTNNGNNSGWSFTSAPSMGGGGGSGSWGTVSAEPTPAPEPAPPAQPAELPAPSAPVPPTPGAPRASNPTQQSLVNKIYEQLQTLLRQLKEISNQKPESFSSATSPKLTKTLKLRDKESQVKILQEFLNQQGFTIAPAPLPGSQGKETTLFGFATQAALTQFQEAYATEILTPQGKTKGNGILGPFTRKVINRLMGR